MKRHLWEATGIEVEYMIVDIGDLAPKPIADELLKCLGGLWVNELKHAGLGWSNELAAHVIELKTLEPVADLGALSQRLSAEVRTINGLLAPYGACLLPSGMHPLFVPATGLRLWSRGDTRIYQAYDRIFGCRTHGFGNLQSVHINLPFSGDAEFGRLHAAVRLALPLIPCLAASSPLIEGYLSGFADTRLEVYRQNQSRLPLIAGALIPEPAATKAM